MAMSLAFFDVEMSIFRRSDVKFQGFSCVLKIQLNLCQDFKAVNTKLSDIAVNSYTASELVRICLKLSDEDDDEEVNLLS